MAHGPAALGHATAEGTGAYAGRLGPRLGAEAFGALGSTGLRVGRIGFGGYRVDDETEVHREALERALRGGVNLIDTSTNYTDGGSERLVGSVLADLAGRQELGRDEVVVVSKIGYVQGQNLALAREREAAGQPFPEMVKYMDGMWHCVHPAFLADQLERSLGRLRLRTLDVCLLHNPEYFFSDAKRRHAGSLPALRDEFYRRVTEAFRFFESQVAAGTLRWYGVSSNTVAKPVDDPEATSLTRFLAASRVAGGPDHHGRVLQLPMNLFEAGGVLEPNNPPDGADGRPGGRTSVLELARGEGIGVLLNRPLNAIVGNGMLRLADVRLDPPRVTLAAQLATVAALEEEYRREIAPSIQVSGGNHPPESFFRWAEQLDGLAGRVQSRTHWEQIEGQIAAIAGQLVRALNGGLSGALADHWGAWRDRYVPELGRLLGELRRQAGQKSAAVTGKIVTTLDPWLPPERRGETLSRKALWVLASTPGVSAVLTGIRTPAYVDDALGILGWPPLAPVRPVYEAIARLRPADPP